MGRKLTGKNNRFPFLDILGYLKNTHKNPKFGRLRQVPGTWLGILWLGLVSLCQIWDFCGYSLNTPEISNIGNLLFFPVTTKTTSRLFCGQNKDVMEPKSRPKTSRIDITDRLICIS